MQAVKITESNEIGKRETFRDKVIYCHPENMQLLVDVFNRYTVSPVRPAPRLLTTMFGIPIHESEHVPRTAKEEVWKPPRDERFCSYSPEDEKWMRPLGLGEVVEREYPCIWVVGKMPAFRFNSAFPMGSW